MSGALDRQSLRRLFGRVKRWRVGAISTAAFVAVMMVHSYPAAATPAHLQYHLQPGPSYASANGQGLFSVSAIGDPAKSTSSINLAVNPVAGSGYTILLNVLDIFNGSAANSPAYLYINGTLPSEVTMYYSSTSITFSGSLPLTATGWVTGAQVRLHGSGIDLYFAFVLAGTADGLGVLDFHYIST